MLKPLLVLAASAWLGAVSSKELCQHQGLCDHHCNGVHKHASQQPVPCCYVTFDVEAKDGQRKIDCRFRGGIIDVAGKPREYCCGRYLHAHILYAPLESAAPVSSPGALSQPSQVALPGIYLQNRVLGYANAAHNIPSVTHTFLFTVREDGTLGATYSWGNKANLRGWHKNAAEDIAAAKVALAGKAALNPAGDANLSPWLEEAYRQRSSPEFEHANKWVDANCKTEADGLLKLAQELKENKGK